MRIQIGDVYVAEGFTTQRPPAGRFYVCDVVPFEGDGPVTRVCLQGPTGREWVPVEDLERRKLYRHPGVR